MDYYDLLGVDSNATCHEIREAYLSKMRIVHPDRFNSDPKAWEEANHLAAIINEAYSALLEKHKLLAKDAKSYTSKSTTTSYTEKNDSSSQKKDHDQKSKEDIKRKQEHHSQVKEEFPKRTNIFTAFRARNLYLYPEPNENILTIFLRIILILIGPWIIFGVGYYLVERSLEILMEYEFFMNLFL
jgi:curved DNA-binding protein CbpA